MEGEKEEGGGSLLQRANPVLMERCHRTSQPSLHDQINQVLDVEQRKVVDDTKAILRYRGIAGMRTTLDIS